MELSDTDLHSIEHGVKQIVDDSLARSNKELLLKLRELEVTVLDIKSKMEQMEREALSSKPNPNEVTPTASLPNLV